MRNVVNAKDVLLAKYVFHHSVVVERGFLVVDADEASLLEKLRNVLARGRAEDHELLHFGEEFCGLLSVGQEHSVEDLLQPQHLEDVGRLEGLELCAARGGHLVLPYLLILTTRSALFCCLSGTAAFFVFVEGAVSFFLRATF